MSALSGCGDVLDVKLPAELTDDALNDPAGASTQLNTIIVDFEEAFGEFFYTLHGREDGGEIGGSSTGLANPYVYTPNQIPVRTFASSLRFATQLHEKLDKDWTAQQVPQKNTYKAIASMYAGASVGILASSLCELSINAGPKLTPAQGYAESLKWLDQAIAEIEAVGDFAMPFGIAPSARSMAYGLRAQVRWMAGDMTGAAADAQRVPQGFTALVTREARPGRRNVAFEQGSNRNAKLYDVIDWWNGAPNPVTGQPWPAIIPFTGYTNLGILPDGRAVREDGVPIRTAGNRRTAVESTAVPDPRVKTQVGIIQGAGVEGHVNARFASAAASIPLVNWKEMWLIRAEAAGGQAAIDLVNQIRAADNLPRVTYADPARAQQIRYMIIEERRRVLFLEGRFYYTKLKNLDLLWFPRRQGTQPLGGRPLEGGVRFVMPDAEYQLNPNLTLNDRATGCAQHERPLLGG